MPQANLESRAAYKAGWYQRQKAKLTPEDMAALRARMAAKRKIERASMTPGQRSVYLSEKRARAMRDRADPAKRARQNIAANASYHRAKTDPARLARQRTAGHRLYVKNQPWRLAQAANLRAASWGLKHDLTPEWVTATWSGKCAVTGLPFVLCGGKRNIFSASLDRIDNTRGYTRDNCRWVLLGVNLLKYTGTDAEMLQIAQAIVRSMK